MNPSRDDIAIVGMACLFPGASDLRAYWENILGKANCLSDPPDDWVGRYAFDPNSSESDRVYNIRGGYLGDLSQFDPMQFGIMPKAIDGTEPEHFLALRVAAQALEDAGVPALPLNRDRTEVILGRGTFVNRGLVTLHQHGLVIHQTLALLKQLHPEYSDEAIEELRRRMKEKLPPLDALTAPGMISSITSGRIANRLDLHGKNHCLDAACASSLIAVEHGIRDLRMGTCDAVLAGGVHVSLNPLVLMLFAQLGALAREGDPRPFSANAAGTLLGEGVGMIVLKRRSDAERDGNRIYALLKGVGSASDGKGKSIVAPRLDGEELALRRAYEDAGVNPTTLELIEAHGTGMTLGDSTELEAITRVFGSDGNSYSRTAIGSVKSMIGHLLPAAGVAGLIKTALALYHKTLPPTIGADEPIGDLNQKQSKFYLNSETRPWIHGATETPRRAGVSAFGFGGINAHAVLEEYPVTPAEEQKAPSFDTAWDSELCIVSGADRAEVIDTIEKVRNFLAQANDVEFKDIAFTLNEAARNNPCRLAIVAGSIEELSKKLVHAENRLRDPSCTRLKDRSGIYYFDEPLGKEGKLAFLFPGEGAQHENMLADLCRHFPEVRHCFDVADRAFLEEGRQETLSQVLFPPPEVKQNDAAKRPESTDLWGMEIAVQSVTTANRALFLLFSRLGITADAMAGHSSGEFGALEASGTFAFQSDEDLIEYIHQGKQTVLAVSQAAEQLPEVMLVAAAAEDLSTIQSVVQSSGQQVVVAMDNCPFQVILCGPDHAAKAAMDQLHAKGISCSVLPFRRAYHTPAFAPACEALREFYAKRKVSTPEIPLYSCATAQLFPQTDEDIRDLALRQWTSPVRFRETVLAMHDAGVRLFLEVGPRGNLSSFVNDILRNRTYAAAAASVRHRSGLLQLHHALGLLAAHGVDMNLNYLYERRSPQRLDWNEPQSYTTSDTVPHKLTMALPLIHLSEEDLQSVRPKAAAPRPVAAEPAMASFPRTIPMPAVTAERKAATPPRSPNADPRRKIDAEQPQRSPRAVKLDLYLETMDKFLQVQEQTFLAALQHGSRVAPRQASPQNTARTSVASIYSRDNGLAAPAVNPQKAPGKLPFVGTVSVIEAGKEITIDRELSVEEDLFLADHVLGGRASFYDPALTALPVVPLTMSIEMLAEAGAELMPGRTVIGIRGIRANRWLSLEEGTVRVRMRARRMNPNEVHVAIREADATAQISIPIIEGTVLLADEYPQAPHAGEFSLTNPRESRFTAQRMYKDAMFSGPKFQAIHSVDQWGEDGQIATLKALPSDNLFRSNPKPRLLAEPVVMDAAGQQVAHWSGEHDLSGFNLFPYQVDEIRFYQPQMDPSVQLQSRLRIEPIKDGLKGGDEIQGFRADMHLVGQEGRLVAQVLGWEVKRFPLPETFYGMLHQSPVVKLAHSWPEPLEDGRRIWNQAEQPLSDQPLDADAFEVRRVDHFPKNLLLSHGKIWMKALVFQVFSRRERQQWNRWHASDSRKIQRLLGRVAAKEAVRAVLRRRHRIEVCPGDIEIDAEETGRPFVVPGPWSASLRSLPRISIAHSGEMAVAIGVDGEVGVDVGIDLERRRDFDITFARAAFSDREQAMLSQLAPEVRGEWATRLWCAKEAVAKAIGIGIGANPTSYMIRAFVADNGGVQIELSGKLAVIKPTLKGRSLFASTTLKDDFIVSLAACPRS